MRKPRRSDSVRPSAVCCASALSILSGCTSLDVKPIPASAKLEKVCIKFNEEVNVDDFVPVVQRGASRGIWQLFRGKAGQEVPSLGIWRSIFREPISLNL